MDYTNRSLMVSHIPEFNLIRLFIKAATKTFHIMEIRECLYHNNTEPEFDWTQVPRMVPCTDQSEIPATIKQTDTNYPYIYIHRKHVHYSIQLVLLWAQLTKISVQPISITKTLPIVPTKNERDPPLFIGKLLIKFQNILRNTTQVIIRHRVKILFSVISSPITLEWQKCKSSKKKGILLSSPVNSW